MLLFPPFLRGKADADLCLGQQRDFRFHLQAVHFLRPGFHGHAHGKGMGEHLLASQAQGVAGGGVQPLQYRPQILLQKRFGLGGAYITKATVQLMRDLGSIPSPHNCFLLNVGLETLPLRMKKHCENAQAVAEYLQGHEKIAWVEYAGLPGDKYYERAKKYLPNGTCGVVVFGVKGGRAAAEKFMAGLKLASIATHVADAKTCVLHPASSTHRQMNDEELAAAGVSPDLVRFSVGIEDAKDIIADLEQALANV